MLREYASKFVLKEIGGKCLRKNVSKTLLIVELSGLTIQQIGALLHVPPPQICMPIQRQNFVSHFVPVPIMQTIQSENVFRNVLIHMACEELLVIMLQESAKPIVLK